MAESYFTTLTNTGKAMFANSPILGTPVSFTALAVGDGNGSYTGLDLAAMLQRTALINEVWRGSINHISTHEENSNWIVVEAFIPSDVGDFDIREVGVLDPDNNLIAIGKYPHTYKPMITQGASKDLYVKMILEVTDTALVTLKVDPTMVLATRQHVADELAAYPEMVRKDAQGNVAIPGNVSIGGKYLTPYAGLKNKIINGNFGINQRVVSGTVALSAGQYGHDRFKAGADGCTYTFSTVENVTTITITAGSLIQIIEGANLQSGTHILSWIGTAQGKIGTGSYGASGVTQTIVGGANTAIKFNTGTLSQVQLEKGSVATPFEQRSIGMELALCQRYYEYIGSSAANAISWYGTISGGGKIGISLNHIEKRANPTAAIGGTWTVSNVSQPIIVGAGTKTFSLSANGLAVGAANTSSTTSSYITLDAEL